MGQAEERPTNTTFPGQPEERGPDSDVSLVGKIGKVLAVVLPGLATAVQLTTAVFGIKPVIPLTPLASVLLIVALALFTWLFVAINVKGDAGAQVYVSLMLVAFLTVASIATLGFANEVSGMALPAPTRGEPGVSSQSPSIEPSTTETAKPSTSSASSPAPTTTPQSTATPAGNSRCEDDATLRFCGRIPIGLGVELDSEPPSASDDERTIDLGAYERKLFNIENTVAQWVHTDDPSRTDCDTTIRKSGLTGSYEHMVSTGDAMCVRTALDQMAFVRVVEVSERAIIVDAIVWK